MYRQSITLRLLVKFFIKRCCSLFGAALTNRIMMKTVVLILSTLLIFGCSDEVTTQYATYTDAQKDSLFERGWLPDILPESTKHIMVVNDLDTNSSQGSFIIEGSEVGLFLENIKPTDNVNQFNFSEGHSKWNFTLKEDGLVLYRLEQLN